METKITATMIELTRAEGLISECGYTVVCKDRLGRNPWETANHILSQWAATAPDGGGYDKCDFTVTYADGETYSGRYDLTRADMQTADLGKHILDFCVYCSGPNGISHMAADYARFLMTYEIWICKEAAAV